MNALGALASTWPARVGLALAVIAALVGWTNPLTDHVGYAASLVAAVVITPLAALAGASLPFALRRRGASATGGAVAAAAGLYGAVLTAAFTLLAALHGLIASPCAPGKGAVFFLLVTLPGAVLAGITGASLSSLVARRWLANLLAVLLVPASIVWSLVRFYRSPAVFAYDPFFGFFPGAMYDETVPLSDTLVTYRLGTVGAIVAAAALLAWRWDPERARLTWSQWRARSAEATALAAGAALALGVYLAGPALGHRFDAHEVARELGGRVEGRRCVILYARSIGGHDARLVRDDCEVRVAQLERFFGVTMRERLTVFLFADAAQKQRLMGAADTYIAKPWRYEVYLQHAAFPHPVLKHEIAHVVAGEMAAGPFYVSARWRLVPLPGLIEGAAVAAAWEGEGDTTTHEWSHAMLDAGLLPDLSSLTGLGFATHAAGTAYTAAGSFSRWLVERQGAARYRVVYRDGDFARAYGRPLGALEREWHAFLRTVPVPPRIQSRARTRFRRAPLMARVCPHETAELYDRAALRLAAGEVPRARDELAVVVRNDPTDVAARVSLAEAWARLGDLSRAAALVDDAARALGPAAAARLRGRVAEVVWRWRGPDAARPLYAAVDPDLFDEDEARTVEVKRWALGLDRTGPSSAPPDRAYTEALQDMLIGRGELGPDSIATASRLLLELRSGPRGAPPDAMASYLVGRLLEAHDRPADAAALLEGVDLARLPSDRVRAEARRLLAVSLYRAGDRARALAVFDEIAADPSRPRALRDVALDWADRIRSAPR